MPRQAVASASSQGGFHRLQKETQPAASLTIPAGRLSSPKSYVFIHVWLKLSSPRPPSAWRASLDSVLLESAVRCLQGTAIKAATHSLLILLGGSLIP
jgi:hypothetical protein